MPQTGKLRLRGGLRNSARAPGSEAAEPGRNWVCPSPAPGFRATTETDDFRTQGFGREPTVFLWLDPSDNLE